MHKGGWAPKAPAPFVRAAKAAPHFSLFPARISRPEPFRAFFAMFPAVLGLGCRGWTSLGLCAAPQCRGRKPCGYVSGTFPVLFGHSAKPPCTKPPWPVFQIVMRAKTGKVHLLCKCSGIVVSNGSVKLSFPIFYFLETTILGADQPTNQPTRQQNQTRKECWKKCGKMQERHPTSTLRRGKVPKGRTYARTYVRTCVRMYVRT